MAPIGARLRAAPAAGKQYSHGPHKQLPRLGLEGQEGTSGQGVEAFAEGAAVGAQEEELGPEAFAGDVIGVVLQRARVRQAWLATEQGAGGLRRKQQSMGVQRRGRRGKVLTNNSSYSWTTLAWKTSGRGWWVSGDWSMGAVDGRRGGGDR